MHRSSSSLWETKAHSWLLLVDGRRRRRSLQQKQITTTLKEKHIATIFLIHQNAFHLAQHKRQRWHDGALSGERFFSLERERQRGQREETMARREQEEDEVKRKRRIDNSTLYSPVSNDKVFVLFCFPSLPYDMAASTLRVFRVDLVQITYNHVSRMLFNSDEFSSNFTSRIFFRLSVCLSVCRFSFSSKVQ
jgi:hypothetical protein